MPLVQTVDLQIVLRPGQIVSLEGGNQSGKSTIIKTLAGAHQPKRRNSRRSRNSPRVDVSCNMSINEAKYAPGSVAHALNHGVVAVFQDDRLIRTMTIEEQLELRHGSARRLDVFRTWLWDQIHPHLSKPLNVLPETSRFRERATDWLQTLPRPRRPLKEVRKQAEDLLKRFDVPGKESFGTILNKFPDELSGGARAIARLVSALMEPRLRYLIMDEAFSGVDPHVWINALERLRDDVEQKKFGILFVSHVAAERIRWQPDRRYLIQDGVIALKSEIPETICTLQAPQWADDEIPVVEIEQSTNSRNISRWLDAVAPPLAVVVDQNVANLEPTLQLIRSFSAIGTAPVVPLEISSDEGTKSLTSVIGVLEYLTSTLPVDKGTVVCIGGGALLNLAGLAAALFLRGKVPTVYVPTTPTAMADVAIGSKTGVNWTLGATSSKHLIGTYFSPSAVVLDRRYLDGLDRRGVVEGLAEIVKHGVVQDSRLLEDALTLADQAEPGRDELYRLAKVTMMRKQEVIIEDLREHHIGRILQYGHLHAHSLERASKFAISHNVAVWCGVYIDLLLAGRQATLGDQEPLYDRIRRVIRSTFRGLELPTEKALRDGYFAETKKEAFGVAGKFSIVAVDSIGCYCDPESKAVSTVEVTWDSIAAAWATLRA